MGCAETPRVRRMMTGGVNREETLAVMDHVRNCLVCRRLITEESRLGVQRGRGGSSVLGRPPQASDSVPEPTPDATHRLGSPSLRAQESDASADIERPSVRPPESSDSSTRPAPVGAYRRRGGRAGLVRLAILGIVILGLMGGEKFFRRTVGASVSSSDRAIAGALVEGRPYTSSPRGRFRSRPKILGFVLPPGESLVRVTILRAGVPVFEREIRPDDDQTRFEDREIPREEGSLPAREVMTPFPGSDLLPLDPGTEYFLLAELPNGNQSAPVSLKIESPR